MNKPISFLMIAAIAVIVLSSCSQELYKSTLQTDTFTEAIDSTSMEPLRFYDSKSKLQYTITNDMQNMYICIKATEEQTQLKIIRAGMKLSIGNLGKDIPEAMIQYPLAMGFQKPNNSGSSNTGRRQGNNNPQRGDIASLKLQFRSKLQEMHLSGFKPQIGAVIPTHNVYGLTVNVDWDSTNVLYYRAIIPFKTFYKDGLSMSDSTKIFNMNITVNGIAIPHSDSEGHQGGSGMSSPAGGGFGGGGMGGGRGGMGGGSRMGGGHGGGGQSHSEINEENKIKFRLQVAVK